MSELPTTQKAANLWPPTHWLDRAVRWMRWPAALASLLSLPLVFLGWWYLVPQCLYHPRGILGLIVGIGAYWMLWRPASVRWGIGDWLVSSETRITRASARWLTRSTIGSPNWLVISSPYFFPTAALLLAIAAAMIPIPLIPWSSLAVGFAMSYHARAVGVVYRKEPEELNRLGRLWCFLFLPGVNLFGVGLLLSVAIGGGELAEGFLRACSAT